MSDYETDASTSEANVAGNWELSIDFQGQQMPVKLMIEQEGNTISGKIESLIGEGDIGEGAVNGNKISATASSEFQGQPVELVIKGTVDDDSIAGTITTSMIPVPMDFTGKRN